MLRPQLQSQPNSQLSLLVAMAQNGVIGKDNHLPWHLTEDLKRFRQLTLGHTMIMGRKTFESIGRLLPGRRTIIISRQSQYRVEGAQVVHSLQEALACTQNEAEVFVIGGAEIYRLVLPLVHRIYLTLIHQEVEGDARFEELLEWVQPVQNTAAKVFQEIRREDMQEPFPYSYLVLERL